MPEISRLVNVVLIELECDRCDRGKMRSYCHVRGSLNGQEHTCDNCGAKKILKDEYPTLSFVWEDDVGRNEKRLPLSLLGN